jgi:hypothetical protein
VPPTKNILLVDLLISYSFVPFVNFSCIWLRIPMMPLYKNNQEILVNHSYTVTMHVKDGKLAKGRAYYLSDSAHRTDTFNAQRMLSH